MSPLEEGAPLQNRLWKLLRTTPPRETLVIPIVLKDRVVSLVYGHAVGAGVLPDAVVGEAAVVCNAAAEAFAGLIHATKKTGKT